MPASQGMNRPAGYRYGSWLALHGSGAHLVGFSTSCWLSGHSNYTMGLWTSCRDTRCSRLYTDDLPGWFVASRVLSCVGVVLLVLWLMVGCQCKCLRTRQQRYKWTIRLEEYLAILSGCIALLSVGNFAVASGRDSTLAGFSLGWSLWLVVGGASACTLGGFIVAGTRNAAHAAPKPCTRAIRPLNSPTVGGISSQTNGQERSGMSVRDPGRHGDVPDIFNVVSYSRNPNSRGSYPGGRTHPTCLAEAAGPPPPPYSARGVYLEAGGGSSGSGNPQSDDPSTQIHELSLSPPPSYEAAMNELPPPYEPRPDYPSMQPEGQQ